MDESLSQSEAPQLIDLTRDVDVNFWCRVFDVSRAQLRDAVHHAGHQVAAVEQYLRHQLQKAS